MMRRGQSASIAIVFIALMFISGFTVFYNQIEAFRQEVRVKEDILSRQVDRARENLRIFHEKDKVIVYNDWTKFSEIKYIVFFNKDNFVKEVIESDILLSPGESRSLQVAGGDAKVGVITSLGNLFLEDEGIMVQEGDGLGSFGNEVGEWGVTSVRVYVNPENVSGYFVVEGLNVIHHFLLNGTKVGTYYLDSYKSLSDTPYRAWVYTLHPVKPFKNFTGWTGFKIVSISKGTVGGGYYGSGLFLDDWIVYPASQANQANSTAYSLSGTQFLGFCAQAVSEKHVLGVRASAAGGKNVPVVHAVLDTISSKFSFYQTNVSLYNSYTYSNYYVWSYSHPYFVTRVTASSNVYATVYKLISETAAIKLFSKTYGVQGYSNFFVANRYYYTFNGTSFYVIDLETMQSRVEVVEPYITFKPTRYGIVFINYNGFRVYNFNLTVYKEVKFSGYSWYYPYPTYSSEYIVDGGDWGYEYFPYQLAFVDSENVLAIVLGEDGRAKVVKISLQ